MENTQARALRPRSLNPRLPNERELCFICAASAVFRRFLENSRDSRSGSVMPYALDEKKPGWCEWSPHRIPAGSEQCSRRERRSGPDDGKGAAAVI